MLLKASQKLQENICHGVSFVNNGAGLQYANLLKKRLRRRSLFVKFPDFLRSSCLYNTYLVSLTQYLMNLGRPFLRNTLVAPIIVSGFSTYTARGLLFYK